MVHILQLSQDVDILCENIYCKACLRLYLLHPVPFLPFRISYIPTYLVEIFYDSIVCGLVVDQFCGGSEAEVLGLERKKRGKYPVRNVLVGGRIGLRIENSAFS